MSRGLSQQQRAILGIATHVNRLTQGGALAVKTGAPVPRYPLPSVDYQGVKDLQWPLAAHLLYGLPFVEAGTRIEKTNGVRQVAGSFFDLRTRPAKSAKASVLRAIISLVRTGWLCAAPTDIPFRWGYVLTEAGLAVGQQAEVPFAPPLIWRAGLIVFPHDFGFLFYRLHARLCRGAITLAEVLTTWQACMPALPRQPDTPGWMQYNQWRSQHDLRAVTFALLGEEEGKSVFPP